MYSPHIGKLVAKTDKFDSWVFGRLDMLYRFLFANSPRFSNWYILALVFRFTCDKSGHPSPKLLLDFIDSRTGVFYNIVQHSGRQYLQVVRNYRAYCRSLKRMKDVRDRSALAHLACMRLRGELNCFIENRILHI